MSLLDKLKYSVDTMTLGERLLAGLLVTAVGMMIVFFALFILFALIKIMGRLMDRRRGKVPGKLTPEIPDVPVVKEVPIEVNQSSRVDDQALVAVITAAVAASLNTSTNQIVVKNIVRTGYGAGPWASSGLNEQIRSYQNTQK